MELDALKIANYYLLQHLESVRDNNESSEQDDVVDVLINQIGYHADRLNRLSKELESRVIKLNTKSNESN